MAAYVHAAEFAGFVLAQITGYWQSQAIAPSYTVALTAALLTGEPPADPAVVRPSFVTLPALCCAAAGGDPGSPNVQRVAAAWALLYSAAHQLDDIEDTSSSVGLGQGVALNVSTGLIFTAFGLLTEATSGLAGLFSQRLLQMCAGQHADLAGQTPSLTEAWAVTHAKSGVFFALACQAGATLGCPDPGRLRHFYDYGLHLGVVHQVLDDLSELRQIRMQPDDLRRGDRWSLPIAYAVSVLPEPARNHLRSCLLAATHLPEASCPPEVEPETVAEARRLVLASGVVLYLTATAEWHLRAARQALALATPPGPARASLDDFLTHSAAVLGL